MLSRFFGRRRFSYAQKQWSSHESGAGGNACSCRMLGQPLSTREEGTLGGAGIGAVGGTIVGAAVGHPLAGAAIGTALGGGTGFAVGNSMQNQENANAQTQHQVQQQQQEIESQRQQIQQLKSQSETE